MHDYMIYRVKTTINRDAENQDGCGNLYADMLLEYQESGDADVGTRRCTVRFSEYHDAQIVTFVLESECVPDRLAGLGHLFVRVNI